MGACNYNSIDISFENKEDEISLYGTLTIPETNSESCIVILLHGSCPMDHNSTIGRHKPFKTIAEYLSLERVIEPFCS